ncbi:MAG TPA: type II secretion system protein [Candidatus Saccharimonadales bacterium]|nr:type II secretion system protein [Candidatus Saccharimonadales bacterium]
MTALNKIKREKGFTLIELLVVIGILAILLAITLIAINPARQFGQADDTKRRSDANAILNAVGQYGASNAGNLPGELSSGSFTTATEINSTNFPNLCSAIMPTYISAIPVDPSITSNTSGITNCATSPAWDTGYQISKDANNRITVWANNAYSGTGTISVTR